MESLLQELIDKHEDWRIEDSSIVHEHDCRSCGMLCCTNTSPIFMSPYDVYRIATDHMAQRLFRIRTSHDLFTPANVMRRPMLLYMLGSDSNIPLTVVNMIEVQGTRFCPFLMTTRIRSTLLGSQEEGPITAVCGIEHIKPAICAPFPIGRVARIPLETSFQGAEYYLICNEKERCIKHRTGEGLTAKEFLERRNMPEIYAQGDTCRGYLDRIRNEFQGQVRYMLGLSLYDIDLPAVDLGKSVVEITKMRVSFADHLRAIREIMDEHTCKA